MEPKIKSSALSWNTVRRKVNDLIPTEKNPRKLSKTQSDNLKKSLEQFDLVEIPAIDTDNKIIAGHQRIKVMQILGRGEEIIDVRIPNRKLTSEEHKRYLITSNAVTGDWDFDLLKEFDVDMLNDIGFDSDLLSNIWDDDLEIKDEEWDEEKELAKIKVPNTKLGDLIILGKHKLICGDSNNPNVLQKLCGDEKASMIYSDPVYNLNINYNKGIGGKQNYGGDVNDTRTEFEYIEFLRKNIKNALSVSKKDCHVFYWNTEQQIWIIQTLYNELNIQNRRVCLWIKNGHNPTPTVAFNKCYEPCIYGTTGSPYLSKKKMDLTEVFNSELGTGNQLVDDINIWAENRLSKNDYSHATQKPPELHHRAIRRCTLPNDIILDTFGGAGSTLSACEQLKRRAYLVELEPVYCDLITDRYERLTGNKSTVIRNHEEIKT